MLYLYDSKLRKKVLFQPIEPGKVGIYVCGVTVYDHCHLGHGRTFTVFDMMIRHFLALGYQVNYIRNITDIDDKILQRANASKQRWDSLAQKMIVEMQQLFERLHLLPPNQEPQATQYISQMIELIQVLLKKGYAYQLDGGDVYFSIPTFADYGRLSQQPLEKLQKSKRQLVASEKQHPSDFVLWKTSKPGEPHWSTPWGEGRPGWHIECSAMSHACLGRTFDIHGGGEDLCFPHHENEIAQSCCGYGGGFAQYWLHSAMITTEKEKMSKSLGNVLSLKDAMADYPPEVLRFYYLSAHYRSALQYSPDHIKQAYNGLNRLYTAMNSMAEYRGEVQASATINTLSAEFSLAMNDDFNTPKAYAVLFELAHCIHRLKRESLPQSAYATQVLKQLGGHLGLFQQTPQAFFQAQGLSVTFVAEIGAAIEKRNQARRAGDWEAADTIRRQLSEQCILLEDLPHGTFWKKQVQ